MLSSFHGARILSHYAASSSTLVLAASFEKNIAPVLSECTRHAWRSLRQAAGPPLDANYAVQAARPSSAPASESPDLAPYRAPSPGMIAAGAAGAAHVASSTAPAAPRSRGPRLKQLLVPPIVLQELRPPTQPYQLTPVLAQRPTGAPAQYTPWTPTRALQRRKHVAKRMGFLMHILEREQTERVRRARPLPDFRAGDILEVRMMLPEAERKVTIYRGVCIARYHKGIRSSFKLYNVYPECGGVVQHIPLYMPDLLGIKVVGRIPASQERLFYLLDRETSDYTFQTGVSAAN